MRVIGESNRQGDNGPMNGTDLSGMAEELEQLTALDPADVADRAAHLADELARALDELDEGYQS